MADQPQRRKANQFAPNDHKPWTLEEMQAVIDRDIPDVDLAEKLGRSEQAVQTKRHYIGKVGMRVAEHYFSGAHLSQAIADLHKADICPGCQLALPATGLCDDCD